MSAFRKAARTLCPRWHRLLAAVTIALLISGIGANTGWSDSKSGEGRPKDVVRQGREPVQPGLLPLMRGEVRFTGTVMDRQERPLAGVRVKLIVNGMVVHAVSTDVVGQYDFKHASNYTGNETVALWFVDPSLQLSPKALILAESPSCRTHKLLSSCYTRIRFDSSIESKVYLFDRETRSQQLVDQGCI